MAILFLPQATASVLPFVILFLVIYFFYNVNYALTWAMMDEGKIPERYSGTAAGIISTVGYLPEIFCSLLAGVLIDGYPASPATATIFLPHRNAASGRRHGVGLEALPEEKSG